MQTNIESIRDIVIFIMNRLKFINAFLSHIHCRNKLTTNWAKKTKTNFIKAYSHLSHYHWQDRDTQHELVFWLLVNSPTVTLVLNKSSPQVVLRMRGVNDYRNVNLKRTLVKLFLSSSTSFCMASNFWSVPSSLVVTGSSLIVKLLSISAAGVSGCGFTFFTVSVNAWIDFFISSRVSSVFLRCSFSLSSFWELNRFVIFANVSI